MSVIQPGDYTEPQAVLAPLSPAAIFLTVTVNDNATAADIKEFLAGFGDLVKDVNFRDPDFATTAVVGIGAELWPDLTDAPIPAQLHPFVEVQGNKHTAVSTPGDLFFHIRANRQDLCFELEKIILDDLEGLVTVVDEVQSFRYFDARDLLGFVDGTANPIGQGKEEAALIGDREPLWAAGSYLTVQKYMHTLDTWDDLTVERQEAIVGRTKLENRELPDAEGDAQKSHKTLNTIEGPDGKEQDILRDNMPFGAPGEKEFGTYFIAYAGDLEITEEMIRRMFIGDPPGKYDEILDFSTAETGNNFFIPPADFLEDL